MRLCVFVLCIAFYLYNRMSFYNMHYTVPILKVSNVYGKSLTVEDFRGVSISPVISKFWNIAFLTDMDISLKRLITNLVLRRD